MLVQIHTNWRLRSGLLCRIGHLFRCLPPYGKIIIWHLHDPQTLRETGVYFFIGLQVCCLQISTPIYGISTKSGVGVQWPSAHENWWPTSTPIKACTQVSFCLFQPVLTYIWDVLLAPNMIYSSCIYQILEISKEYAEDGNTKNNIYMYIYLKIYKNRITQ